jgi:hypothetical protein
LAGQTAGWNLATNASPRGQKSPSIKALLARKPARSQESLLLGGALAAQFGVAVWKAAEPHDYVAVQRRPVQVGRRGRRPPGHRDVLVAQGLGMHERQVEEVVQGRVQDLVETGPDGRPREMPGQGVGGEGVGRATIQVARNWSSSRSNARAPTASSAQSSSSRRAALWCRASNRSPMVASKRSFLENQRLGPASIQNSTTSAGFIVPRYTVQLLATYSVQLQFTCWASP